MNENQKLKLATVAVGVLAIAVVTTLIIQWQRINQPASEIDQNTKEIEEYRCKIAPNDPECKK